MRSSGNLKKREQRCHIGNAANVWFWISTAVIRFAKGERQLLAQLSRSGALR